MLDQKIKPLEFLNRIKAKALYFNELNKNELRALKHWIKNTTETPLAEIAIDILESKREDVERMVASNAFILSEEREQARKEGRNEGRVEGKEELLIKQLNKKIGKLSEETIKKLKSIDNNVLDKIAIDIFDIDSIEDLKKYFN